MIERPFFNGYCKKCVYCYLLDGDEERCRKIKLGMSNMMCVQVVECPYFTERKEKQSE